MLIKANSSGLEGLALGKRDPKISAVRLNQSDSRRKLPAAILLSRISICSSLAVDRPGSTERQFRAAGWDVPVPVDAECTCSVSMQTL